ncbi:MAG TPA: EamA family transporter [Desulfomicrobium sp.]|nr:EamA family transporter [Desulfomicrobium sp.]
MNSRTTRANILLLLTAMIWGAAFVAQRVGMDHMGPLTFNAVRFALGAAALLPLIAFLDKKRTVAPPPFATLLKGGVLMGLALFLGAWLQQFGLCYTTAGKAGFITGLYVVFVPIIGIFLGQRYGTGTWAGAGLAIAGMYLLSVTESFSMDKGDALVLMSAFFWGIHVLLVGRLTQGIKTVDAVRLAAIQFATCSLISFAGAAATEDITLAGLRDGLIPILYGGLMSVGVAYTLQVVAQRDARPAPAAIILSLEAVFAALTGWLMLGEILTTQAVIGCALMLCGMIWSQARP